jgi:aldehyde:ferredoxin oxidoreductase
LYTPELVSYCLATAGFNLDKDTQLELGKEILQEKFKYKFREGFSFDNLRIPKRIYKLDAFAGKVKKEYLEQCLMIAKDYYK